MTGTPLRVLFIGNSFTARHTLPGLVAQMAETRNRHMVHRLISAGGASLRMHWNKGEAQKAFQESRYDYVVLQEQSTLPIKNPVRMHENIRLFDNAIKASGAKTALYLTWARQNAMNTQKAITSAYTAIGQEIGAAIVPAGVAWQNFMRKHDRPVLHDADMSHPTLAGSYLAACVFFTVLFNETPAGIVLDIKGLAQSDAELLQVAAEEAMRTMKK